MCSTHTCIYCKQSRPISEFNREHVVPDSFGTYDNALIIRCVCTDCNERLGRETDLVLARGSIEGAMRYGQEDLMGGTHPRRSATLRRRVLVTLPGIPGWEGVRFELAVRPGSDARIHVPPQIGLRSRETGELVYFLLDELESEALDLDAFDLSGTGSIHIRCDSEKGEKGAKEVLAKLRIPFVPEGKIGPPADLELTFRYDAPYDTPIRRAIAKIAFNHLAHEMGAEFTLKDCFDEVRSFIAHGVEQIGFVSSTRRDVDSHNHSPLAGLNFS